MPNYSLRAHASQSQVYFFCFPIFDRIDRPRRRNGYVADSHGRVSSSVRDFMALIAGRHMAMSSVAISIKSIDAAMLASILGHAITAPAIEAAAAAS